MHFLAVVLAALPALVLSSPVPAEVATVTPLLDTSSHCGQWDTISVGSYQLNLDQWEISGATGWQCAGLSSQSGNTISWWTSWSWSGNNNVKTFTDIQLNSGINKQLKNIGSIPSVWSWGYDTYSITADVAYDLFTSNSAGGSRVYEVMIWLANINAGPISSSYPAQPIASNLNIAGHTWNLYKGPNGNTQVFSFLPTSGYITYFNGDVNGFLKYLTSYQGVSSSQYLITAQAGTEPFTGTATLSTYQYSMSIN